LLGLGGLFGGGLEALWVLGGDRGQRLLEAGDGLVGRRGGGGQVGLEQDGGDGHRLVAGLLADDDVEGDGARHSVVEEKGTRTVEPRRDSGGGSGWPDNIHAGYEKKRELAVDRSGGGATGPGDRRSGEVPERMRTENRARFILEIRRF
jgi:hypothetical protein